MARRPETPPDDPTADAAGTLADALYDLLGCDLDAKRVEKLLDWTLKLQSDSYATGYSDGMADCEQVYLGKYDH